MYNSFPIVLSLLYHINNSTYSFSHSQCEHTKSTDKRPQILKSALLSLEIKSFIWVSYG